MAMPKMEAAIVRKVCSLLAAELELEVHVPENEIARLREEGQGELSAIDSFETLADFLMDYVNIHSK